MRQHDPESVALGHGAEESASDRPLPAAAADLVAALWRDACAATRVANVHPSAALGDVRAALVEVAAQAEALAHGGPDPERPAAQLLADTARAANSALDAPAVPPAIESDEGGWLPSAVRRRLSRMEQWLSARAATDPTAEPAANLCLWLLDQLEADAM